MWYFIGDVFSYYFVLNFPFTSNNTIRVIFCNPYFLGDESKNITQVDDSFVEFCIRTS